MAKNNENPENDDKDPRQKSMDDLKDRINQTEISDPTQLKKILIDILEFE